MNFSQYLLAPAPLTLDQRTPPRPSESKVRNFYGKHTKEHLAEMARQQLLAQAMRKKAESYALYREITGERFTYEDIAKALKYSSAAASNICRRMLQRGLAVIVGEKLSEHKRKIKLYEWVN